MLLIPFINLYFFLLFLFSPKRTKQTRLKRTLFSTTRQYNTYIFNKIIFFKYRSRQIKATETNKKVTYLHLAILFVLGPSQLETLFHHRSFLVDPLSYISFRPVLHDWCNKGSGICYPVCGMMHMSDAI